MLTWSVETFLPIPAEVRYLQALVSVLQPPISSLGGPQPLKAIPMLATEVLTWQIRSAWTEHWATMKKPGGQMVHFWQRGWPLLKPQYSSLWQLPQPIERLT